MWPDKLWNNLDDLSKNNNDQNETIRKWPDKSKLEEIRKSERLDMMIDGMRDIWLLDKEKHIWEFSFMDESWSRVDISIDISDNIIKVWSTSIKIEMPSGANITNIAFKDSVQITWKKWPFTWSWTTKYSTLLDALDKTLNNWSHSIPTSSWNVILRNMS